MGCANHGTFPPDGYGASQAAYFTEGWYWDVGPAHCTAVNWATAYSVYTRDDYKRCVCATAGAGAADCPQANGSDPTPTPPAPEPQPDPQPEPQPEPQPDPQPDPQPEPAPQPDPILPEITDVE